MKNHSQAGGVPRCHPAIAWSEGLRAELRERIDRGSATLAEDRKLLRQGEGSRDSILSSMTVNASDLAKARYAAGDPIPEVRAAFGASADAYMAYHELVLGARGSKESPVWGQPARVENALFLLTILGRAEDRRRLAMAPKETVESPEIDYGPEFLHSLHALRAALVGETAVARDHLESARKVLNGGWEIYTQGIMSKPDRERFSGLKALEDHPLGALLSGRQDRFLADVEALAEGYDRYAREAIRKKRMNPVSLCAGTAFSVAATAFAALGRERGFPAPREHIAIAKDLLPT